MRVLVAGTNSAGSSLATSGATGVVSPLPLPVLTPVITGVRQSAKTWREAGKPKHPTKKHPPTGTTFSLTLNESASVSFSFSLKTAGRKAKGHCVKQTAQNRHQSRCTLKSAAGTLVLTAHAGVNKISFAGHLPQGKKLRPGSYTVSITATAAGKRSKAKTLSFTIAP